ncbi:MAG: hypothetical protein LBJ00_17485 [Planctomycetaceae bacterium]|nr:hypothetical protein [Planctomycetaceae bacterium]
MKKILIILVAVLVLPQVLLQDAGSYAADDMPELKLPACEAFRSIYNKRNDIETDKTNGVEGQHTKITVTPADLPCPLLKYRFNMYVTEMESGNAAPLYSEAYAKLENTIAQTLKANVYEKPEYAKAQFPELFNIPLEKQDENAIEKLSFKAFPSKSYFRKIWEVVTAEQEEKMFKSLQPVYNLIEKASKKRECDWSYQQKFWGFSTVLNYVTNIRLLCKYLEDKAEWEIRNGKYDDAVKTIRLGLRVAEHVEDSDFPCMITSLIALACRGVMLNDIMLLSAQPDAPNLYPALTQINRNKNMYKKGLQMEQFALFYAESPQESQELMEREDELNKEESEKVLKFFAQTIMEGFPNQPSDIFVEDVSEAKITTAAICLLCYRSGKTQLLKRGLTEAEIDKLSVYQVVTPFIVEELRIAYDKLIVANTLPIGSKHTAIEFSDDVESIGFDSPVDLYLQLFIPAVTAANKAILRTEQSIDLLQITEAIRYYAAFNNGNLPESLDQIEQLHVNKIGVVNNKPFAYRIEGDKAIIDYFILEQDKSRLEITLDKK